MNLKHRHWTRWISTCLVTATVVSLAGLYGVHLPLLPLGVVSTVDPGNVLAVVVVGVYLLGSAFIPRKGAWDSILRMRRLPILLATVVGICLGSILPHTVVPAVAVCTLVWVITTMVVKHEPVPTRVDRLEPIVEESQDQYDMVVIAKRMAERVFGDVVSSQIVFGGFGVGKSSCINLFKRELERSDGGIEFVHIDLWAYTDSQAAERDILEQIVAVLSRRVSTWTINGTVDTIMSSLNGTKWSILSKLFWKGSSVEDRISRISKIATDAEVRIVVIVEEMERLAGATESVPIVDVDSIRPLISLLHILARNDAFHVVIATTPSESVKTTLTHKAFHTYEYIPHLSWYRIAGALNEWRTDQSRDIIDPNASVRSDLGWNRPTWSQYLHKLDGAKYSYATACVSLIRTPRQLNLVLETASRRACKGELDFDACLGLSIIEVCAPLVFTAICDNIHSLHDGIDQCISEDSGVQTFVDLLIPPLHTPKERGALSTIISTTVVARRDKLQGPFRDHEMAPTHELFQSPCNFKYWRRYMDGAGSGVSDQDIYISMSTGDMDTVAEHIISIADDGTGNAYCHNDPCDHYVREYDEPNEHNQKLLLRLVFDRSGSYQSLVRLCRLFGLNHKTTQDWIQRNSATVYDIYSSTSDGELWKCTTLHYVFGVEAGTLTDFLESRIQRYYSSTILAKPLFYNQNGIDFVDLLGLDVVLEACEIGKTDMPLMRSIRVNKRKIQEWVESVELTPDQRSRTVTIIDDVVDNSVDDDESEARKLFRSLLVAT